MRYVGEAGAARDHHRRLPLTAWSRPYGWGSGGQEAYGEGSFAGNAFAPSCIRATGVGCARVRRPVIGRTDARGRPCRRGRRPAHRPGRTPVHRSADQPRSPGAGPEALRRARTGPYFHGRFEPCGRSAAGRTRYPAVRGTSPVIHPAESSPADSRRKLSSPVPCGRAYVGRPRPHPARPPGDPERPPRDPEPQAPDARRGSGCACHPEPRRNRKPNTRNPESVARTPESVTGNP